MDLPDFNALQQRLVACQTLLDEARVDGWDADREEAFAAACLQLHELAVIRRHFSRTAESHQSPETPLKPDEQAASEPTATNRLLTPEERGDAPTSAQVDLLSSIGEMTLAEKLALQPLGHVAEGLSIVERAQFTSVLFSGEEEVFSALLEKIGRAATQEEAMALFGEALHPRGEDGEVAALQEDFAKRIVRTFLS